jgi:cytochrome P450
MDRFLLVSILLFSCLRAFAEDNCSGLLWRPPAPVPHEQTLGTIALLRTLAHNPIEAWSKAHFEQPFVNASFAGIQATVVNSPASIRHVLMDNRANYEKDNLQKRVMTRVLANGLLMTDGDRWKGQRKTLAPIFNHRTVMSFAPAMLAAANKLSETWASSPDGTIHDVSVDIGRLTLDVLQRTIFSGGLGGDPEQVRSHMHDYFEAIGRIDPFDLLNMPDYIPRLSRIRARKSLKYFDQAVDNIIAARKKILAEDPGNAPDDILTHLLKAQNPQMGYAMSEEELHSNIITFIAAGHESTANAIMWSLYTLSQSPYWRDLVVQEVKREFAGPTEGLADRLVYTRAVIEETIRLYPPIAAISRAALEADDLEGCKIAPGSMVVIPTYVVHRHRNLWEQPDMFDPSRFLGRSRETVDRFTYLPFGAGPRVCIGQPFAIQNATLAVGTLIKNFDMEIAPGHKVWPELKVSLKPAGGLPMIIRKRTD